MMEFDFVIDLEARKKYTSRRKMDLIRCRECLQNNDLSTIETIGHNLKGNGISFGYPELSQLGEKIESSAKQSNVTEIKLLVDRLEQWLEGQRQTLN